MSRVPIQKTDYVKLNKRSQQKIHKTDGFNENARIKQKTLQQT